MPCGTVILQLDLELCYLVYLHCRSISVIHIRLPYLSTQHNNRHDGRPEAARLRARRRHDKGQFRQQLKFHPRLTHPQFIKPRGKVDYPELGFEAGVKALLDAHINYDDVDQGVACYCYGDSTCGQRVFYQFGMTGIPVYNVNNNCSTGSTGLYMGRNMIAHGAADCVLVVGFEKMFPGSLQSFFQDRSNPTATTNLMLKETRGVTKAPGAAQLFGNAGREHMEK